MTRKAISIFVVIVMLLSLSLPAFAIGVETETSLEPIEESTLGDLIWSTSYIDENGNHIDEYIYFAPKMGSDGLYISSNGNISVMADEYGEGTYTRKKVIANTDPVQKYMYVSAYFVWGNGDVSVSNPKGWHDDLGSAIKITGANTTTGTGRFAGLFNKYAYAEYSFISTNIFGIQQGNVVRITVSQSGNIS